VTDCKLLKYEWDTMWTGQDSELKAGKNRKKLKMVEKLVFKKYVRAKIA
jgi:hypothetical protein